jgi:hypothetical protein
MRLILTTILLLALVWVAARQGCFTEASDRTIGTEGQPRPVVTWPWQGGGQ